MKIVFVNQKGGVGKTTLSLLSAAILKKAGYDIALEDMDPQGSARLIAPHVLDVPLIEDYPDADYIITDTPPRFDEEIFRDVLSGADRIILVTRKSPLDVLAAQPMAELVKSAKNKKAKAYVLFNAVESRTTVGSEDPKVLAKTVGLTPLKEYIPHSTRYERLATDGLASITGKWRESVLNVMLEILK